MTTYLSLNGGIGLPYSFVAKDAASGGVQSGSNFQATINNLIFLS